MLTISLILFSAVALILFFLLSRHAVSNPENLETLEARMRPVDMNAFLTLVDQRDDKFLQAALKPEAFRRVHRLRTWATLKYLRILFSNVTILLRIADLVTRSTDSGTAESGRELVQIGLQTRILILRAFLNLIRQLVVPTYSKNIVARLLSNYLMIYRRFTFLSAAGGMHRSGSSLS